MYSRGYYPVPHDEATRLARLDEYDVHGRESEHEFDQLTRLATRLFDVPICLISIIGKDTQWLVSHEGLDIDSTPRDAAFCSRTIMADQPLVVLDATKDGSFADNPLVTGDPSVRFYAGAPLIVDDDVRLGALCLMDKRPHDRFDARQRGLLRDLAAIVAQRLVLRREVFRKRRTQDERTQVLNDRYDDQLREADRTAQQQIALRKLIEDIDALMRESHMLAINSAVEAARHGQEGRAFATIAAAMKTLASSTRAAAARAREVMAN